MSNRLPLVAIIGQTNAGKSSLFNRLVGKQDAIVAREAGTTRDSVVRTVDNRFILVDTAGLKDPTDDFEATIQTQVDDAIASADLILLVKDITTYPDQTDRDISKKVLKSRKPVILVLNKADLKEKISPDEYLRLGIRDILVVSAEHNQGIAKLRREIISVIAQKAFSPGLDPGIAKQSSQEYHSGEPLVLNLFQDVSESSLSKEKHSKLKILKQVQDDKNNNSRGFQNDNLGLQNDNHNPIRIALIGRPNVGKSHLFNTLAGKQQAIVAPVAGTTRDINRVSVKYHGQTIELLDTAGVRRPGKVEQGVEKFSVLRTIAAIEESDICLLLMDVNELNTSLDQKLAGMIDDAGKGLIIVISKWDTVGEQSSDEILHQIASTFDFVPWASVIFTSSVTGKNVTKIFELATAITAERAKEIPTSRLNKLLQTAILRHPPAGLKNTHPKFRYVVQTDVAPPWFVIYGSNLKFIHWSYKRYLERQFRDQFGFTGTPIKFSFRDEKQIKKNRENTL